MTTIHRTDESGRVIESILYVSPLGGRQNLSATNRENLKLVEHSGNDGDKSKSAAVTTLEWLYGL
jgi:hypothetical protein